MTAQVLREYVLQLRYGEITQVDFMQGVRSLEAVLEAEHPNLPENSKAYNLCMDTLNTAGRFLMKGGE